MPLTQTPAGITFRVRVVPRSGRTAVSGVRGDALLVRLAAAPVDGAANDELLAMLAATLGCPKRHVTIASGDRGRDKVVRVAGMALEQVSARLLAILPA